MKTNTKIVDSNQTIEVMTLIVNRPNNPFKRPTFNIKKARPNHMLFLGNELKRFRHR